MKPFAALSGTFARKADRHSAPRKIREGYAMRDGGIFVNKRDPNKLRGYVWRAGAITHVGNLSGVKHHFVDQDIPAEF